MKPTPITTLLPLFLVLVFHHSFSHAGLKEECTDILRVEKNLIGFCITSLQVMPGAATADTAELAIMVGNLARANGTSTRAAVKELFEKETNKSIKDALSVCVEMYDDSLDMTRLSLHALKVKSYDEAMTDLDAGVANVDTCNQGYVDFNVKCPFDKENDNFSNLMILFMDFAYKLKNPHKTNV